MKKIFGLTCIGLASLIFGLQFGISSCTKDRTITDTVTVIKRDTLIQVRHDTLRITDTALNLQILTANPWKLQEERGVVGNMHLYYLRGGASNT